MNTNSVIGAVTIYAGLEVAYLGFGGLTTMIGISMIIYFIWIGILVALCGKNLCQSIIRKFEDIV
jgi:hypothetical protein